MFGREAASGHVGQNLKFIENTIPCREILGSNQGPKFRCVGEFGLSNLGSNVSLVDVVCSENRSPSSNKTLVLRSRHVAVVHR